MDEKRKKLLLGFAFFLGLGIVVFLGFYLNSSRQVENIESVSVIKDGKELTVNSDGSVAFSNEDGLHNDKWSNEKTQTYFNYFLENYSGESQVVRPGQNVVTVVINGKTYTYILNDDEIVDAAGEDATEADSPTDSGNGDGNGGGDEGDINQYFSPTPFPTSNYSPTPVPTTSSGGGSFMDECLFWRLSYCVIPIPPAPTAGPSPTGSSDPDANVIQVNNCGQYLGEGNNQPTIISNTVCLPE